MDKYSTKVFSELFQLDLLQDDWRKLSSIDPNSSLCNSFEWIDSWIKHYWTSEFELNIVLFYMDGKAVALLPLYIQKSKMRVMFLGTGEPEACEVASEYLDFLIDNRNLDPSRLYNIISKYLVSFTGHTSEFVNCLESSHVVKVTTRLKNVRVQRTGKRYHIQLAEGYENIFNKFKKNQKKKSRETLNRFHKNGNLLHSGLITSDFTKHWSILRDIHTKNWLSRGKVGAFSNEIFSDFHTYMHTSHPQVTQFFSYISDRDTIFSINHYYRYKNTLFYYTSGMDRSVFRNLSSGNLLHILTLQELSGEHLDYDFMKGKLSNSYKENYCNATDHFCTITIYESNTRGTLKYIWRKLKDILLELRPE